MKCSTLLFRSTLSIFLISAVSCSHGPSRFNEEKTDKVDHKSISLLTDRVVRESRKFQDKQDAMQQQLQKIAPEPIKPVEPTFNPLDLVKVSIDITNEDARHVFHAIADHAGLNLFMAPELNAEPHSISLHLKDLPASQVFEQVLNLLDMDGAIQGNVLIIKPYIDKVFNLDMLQTQMNADFSSGGDVFGSGIGSDSGGISGGGLGGGNSGGGSGGSGGGGGSSGGQGIQGSFNLHGQNIGSEDPYEPIETMLSHIVGEHSESEKSSPKDNWGQSARSRSKPVYVLNKTTGTLFVRARPSQMAVVTELIERYKTVSQRQLLIEAQIFDVALNDEYQYGVDWSILKNQVASVYGPDAISIGGGQTTLPGAENVLRDLIIPAASIGGLGPAGLGIAATSGDFNVVVNLLKTFGNVHVLSNPSLRVQNAQPAIVSVGRTERYIAQTTSNIIATSATTTSNNIVTGSVFDGVVLGVVPFIGEDKRVNLTINPMQTKVEPGSTTPVNVGGSDANQVRVSLPKIDFKGMTTSLSMRDGDTVILGGLINEDGGQNGNGIPWLSDIPYLGYLFGGRGHLANVREMVIILRVHVL
ncbi:MAG: pilus (MSHA type) biogenesis protein MshL [Methylococcales bacterium]|nr:pilus (MSHA type) biogenesis protein MshL [Methylococcales bacterium]